jgi:hypothetical protein
MIVGDCFSGIVDAGPPKRVDERRPFPERSGGRLRSLSLGRVGLGEWAAEAGPVDVPVEGLRPVWWEGLPCGA